jgi:L-threonylcarbamoyladenylate synthase
MQSVDIADAAARLERGELVAFPTETVYGLGADAGNVDAVRAIFAAKGRPADHPLIVHLSSADQMDQWAREVPEAARRVAASAWPGPLTMILKKGATVLPEVTGGQDTVGLRVPSHPVAQQLLAQFGRGVAAPSANRFGHLSPTSAQHVLQEFGGEVFVLDGGPCRVGIESTIVDFSREVPVVLRPGHFDAVGLSAWAGVQIRDVDRRGDGPRVSGSLASHYAPTTTTRLVDVAELPSALARLMYDRKRIGLYARRLPVMTGQQVYWRQMAETPEEVARELYSMLRDLDTLSLDEILVERLPDGHAWDAVRDRLQRATARHRS